MATLAPAIHQLVHNDSGAEYKVDAHSVTSELQIGIINCKIKQSTKKKFYFTMEGTLYLLLLVSAKSSARSVSEKSDIIECLQVERKETAFR